MRTYKSLAFACVLLIAGSLIVAGCASSSFAIPRQTPAATPTIEAKKPYEIAVVVKIGGIPWFNVLETGVTQAAQDFNQNAYVVRPKSVDPAQQIAIVEQLVDKRVDALAVMPNDVASLEPVLKRAREQGILVLTQESVNQVSNDYDFELIDNAQFARANWDALTECMGSDSGEYAVLIGAMDMPLQKLWSDEGLKYAREKYPNLILVADPIPYSENQELARQKAVELIQKHPALKGVIGLGSLGPPGAAQAVKDKGLQDKICVVGTALPTHAAPFIKDGSLDEGLFWNPRDAGYGLVWLAKQILDGQKIGNDTEIPGLGPLTVDGKIVRANSIIRINKDNVDSFGF
jgi:simple sugar transport system substrate-binding protein